MRRSGRAQRPFVAFGVLHQQVDEVGREARQHPAIAHADVLVAQRPVVAECDDADRHGLRMAARRRFRQDADTRAGLDQQAGRLEVADLDAQLDRAVHVARALVEELVDGAGFVQADVLVVERVDERHRPSVGQRVSRRHRQHHVVAAVRDDFEVLGAHRAGDDADVGRAVGDRTHDVVAHALAQVDVDVRVGRQVTAQHRRQEFGDRRGAGGDAQVALEAARVLLQVAAHALELVQHDARVMQQRLAGRGQGHALGRAVQQLGADRRFEVLDARAGRG